MGEEISFDGWGAQGRGGFKNNNGMVGVAPMPPHYGKPCPKLALPEGHNKEVWLAYE